MPSRLITLFLAATLAALSIAGVACAADATAYEDYIGTIVLESTPAWGSDEEFLTSRIKVLLSSAQVILETEHNGRVQEQQRYSVTAEQLTTLMDACFPALLEMPDADRGMALDGWYAYITVSFEGQNQSSYTMRFGGHVADLLGPAGFQAACAAIRDLAEQAVESGVTPEP